MELIDVLIIGGGPAGLTAAIFTSRANLKTTFVERDAPGGKMVKTFSIENWSGDKEVSGPNLSLRMFNHAQSFGAKYQYGNVQSIDAQPDGTLAVKLEDKTLYAKTVIVATGMVERVPETVKNIHQFENRGVSYCAICDGPVFRDQPIAFIGGGNGAVDEALYTTQFAKHVYMFVRGKDFSAEPLAVKRLRAKPNVTVFTNAEINELIGKDRLEKIVATIDNKVQTMDVSALFPYIGQVPVSSFVKHLKITNEYGFILTNEQMETSVKNLFAIGDIRVKEIRQIATAVADGVVAAKVIATRL